MNKPCEACECYKPKPESAQKQVDEMMAVLDALKVPKDPDPVNRLKRLTSAYTAVAENVRRLAKEFKRVKRWSKLHKGW